jgi:hypothetical protein
MVILPASRPSPDVGVVRVATIRDARGAAPQHGRRRTWEGVGKMELGGGCGYGALGIGGERTAQDWGREADTGLEPVRFSPVACSLIGYGGRKWVPGKWACK